MIAAPPPVTGDEAITGQGDPPAVELRNVTKAYPGPVVALDQVSLRVSRGQALAIVGASGSGKTTLLHLMGTLDAPTAGEVLLDGHHTGRLDDRRLAALRSRHLGFVFQNFHLSDRLTAIDNVASGLLYTGVPRRQRRPLAFDALDLVGLSRRAGHFPSQLSGGERQRVAIARAVVHRPLLLLADEPTGALDSATGRAVLDLLLDLHRVGTTLIVITHDLNVAARLPARVRVADGRVQAMTGRPGRRPDFARAEDMTAVRGQGSSRLPVPARLSPLDVVQLATLGMRSRPLRAVLSLLGVAVGMATLVLVVSIPQSSNAALLAKFTALDSNLLEAEAQQPQTGPAVSFPPDAAAMAARIGPVTAAAELGNTGAVVRRSPLVPSATTVGLSVLASSPNLLTVVSGAMEAGQFLSPATQRFPVAVLGYHAAGSLGIEQPAAPGRPVRVMIGSRWFTVIGIAAPMPVTSDLDWAVFVGWNTARAALGFNGRATVGYVRAPDDELAAVAAVLGPTLYPPAPGLVNVTQPSDALAAKQATQAVNAGLLIGLAAVSLLVGGIGIANTMFVAVMERRQEIGLRRALGATRGQIRLQFLGEAVTLSALGGLTGATIGCLAATGYALWEGWPPILPVAVIAFSAVSAIAVGALAGLHPAIRAARLTPTEALASP